MKKELDRMPNIPEVQKDILEFWKDNKTFEKSLHNDKEKESEYANCHIEAKHNKIKMRNEQEMQEYGYKLGEFRINPMLDMSEVLRNYYLPKRE